MAQMIDSDQRERFLRTAAELGYDPNELIPTRSSSVDGNFVRIMRGAHQRKYPCGTGINWADDAIRDLRAGVFGEPKAPAILTSNGALAVQIPGGPNKGKWAVDAWFEIESKRTAFPNNRVFPSEVEAQREGDLWLRNRLNGTGT